MLYSGYNCFYIYA